MARGALRGSFDLSDVELYAALTDDPAVLGPHQLLVQALVAQLR